LITFIKYIYFCTHSLENLKSTHLYKDILNLFYLGHIRHMYQSLLSIYYIYSYKVHIRLLDFHQKSRQDSYRLAPKFYSLHIVYNFLVDHYKTYIYKNIQYSQHTHYHWIDQDKNKLEWYFTVYFLHIVYSLNYCFHISNILLHITYTLVRVHHHNMHLDKSKLGDLDFLKNDIECNFKNYLNISSIYNYIFRKYNLSHNINRYSYKNHLYYHSAYILCMLYL